MPWKYLEDILRHNLYFMYKMWLESVKAAQDSSFQLGQSPISRHNFNQELAINNEENWAKNGRKAKLNWGEQGNFLVFYSNSTTTKKKIRYCYWIYYIIYSQIYFKNQNERVSSFRIRTKQFQGHYGQPDNWKLTCNLNYRVGGKSVTSFTSKKIVFGR